MCAKRLTIAIPNGLYERLQTVKQEINISGVCQEALNMAITLKETQTQALTFDHKQLIDRLKLEKKLLVAQIKEQGRKLGIQSAMTLSYKEFQRIERLSQGHVRIEASSFAGMWKLLASRQPEQNMEFEGEELREMASLNEENKAIFVEGWMEGVLTVWNQIKDELNDMEAE
jgi:mannose/fructose/N-acetylgalactosamine-specific phosphotransferase system component IIB